MTTGIRGRRENLSRYIRRRSFERLVAAVVIRAPIEAGDPTEDWPDIRLPPGTVAELIEGDRGEA